MDDIHHTRLDSAGLMAEAMGVLAEHLRAEVAFTKATRGAERQEAFLGLTVNDEEADVITAELAGRVRAGDQCAHDEIEARWTVIREIRSADRTGIWSRMAVGFQLTEIELDLIMLAAAPALDPRFGRIYGYLNDDMARRHLTPALALRLLGQRGLDTVSLFRLLSPTAPLRRFSLLELDAARPFIESPLRIEDSFIARLIGDEAALDGLRDRFWVLPLGETPLPCTPVPSWFVEAGGIDPGPGLVNLAHQHGWTLALVSLHRLDPGERVTQLGLALREARLMQALPVILYDGPPSEDLAALLSTGAAVVTQASAAWMKVGLTGSPMPPCERKHGADREGWIEALFKGDPRHGVINQAHHMRFLDLIETAFRHRDMAGLAHALEVGRTSAFGSLAQVSRPGTRLDDMVLSARTRSILQDFIEDRRSAARVLGEWGLGAQFGKTQGAAALFRGPPGTGKTMAAGAVASALERPLVRIDLSGLVSKYIGETEKNLERAFSAAEASGAVLFFDEADALFGRRSEVSDAHDRYANLETSYLLQRLEDFTGITVLASNLHQNIDDAFLRRLDQIIDFPAPGPVERASLWRRIEATRAPLARDVDFDTLAQRFDLTGGEIRNCWLDAAHRAARAGGAITMDHLIDAVARELTKQGRPIRRGDFGEHFAKVRGGGAP